MRFLKLSALLVAAGVALWSAGSQAAEGAVEPKQISWPQNGFFGTFDRTALQRGFKVYQEVCHGCHAAKYLTFRSLADLGFNEDEVKAIAAEVEVTAGPNDQGEMFQRPGVPADRFKAPFPNDEAARASNNGALPPDLSLMAKARVGGEDYVYALLTGYEDAPEGVTVPDGQYYNKYFPGHMIGMPPILQPDGVSYADDTQATVEQMAHDVATFLTWAAEPKLEARKQMGVKVILFLLVFSGLLYAVKRRVWAAVH